MWWVPQTLTHSHSHTLTHTELVTQPLATSTFFISSTISFGLVHNIPQATNQPNQTNQPTNQPTTNQQLICSYPVSWHCHPNSSSVSVTSSLTHSITQVIST